MSSSNSQERPCVVWPLMYFEAQWEHDLCDLGSALFLVRARPSQLSLMAQCLESSPKCDARYADAGGRALRDDVEWLMVNRFLHEGSMPVEDLGTGQTEFVQCLDPVHEQYAKAFLTALCVVKPNRAIAPVAFGAEQESDGRIVPIGSPQERADLWGDPYEPPWCHEETTPFDDDDLERLGEVWRGIDRFAFSSRLEEKDTRLGRAMLLFESGMSLPLLHAFLSMWLVLETLYTDGKGELAHKLATRLARILGGESFDTRECYFERARNAYNQRSKIVHGEKTIDRTKSIDKRTKDALKDTFQFARESLERILCNEELFDWFAERKEDGIHKFFRRLDLGEWELNPEP